MRMLNVFTHSAETHQTVLSLISCFAGGVFLSACLLDIIPDYLSDINMELDAREMKVRGRGFGEPRSRSSVQGGATMASIGVRSVPGGSSGHLHEVMVLNLEME